jgi:6-phosphogluconolactonase/glucosamine-6-phosphate isomerase/deaminase
VVKISYIKINSQQDVADYLFEALAARLAKGQSVLWLVAGGSSIDIAVKVAKNLQGYPGVERLTVSLTDERYGEDNHPDSNWKQLFDRGFALPGARLLPVLCGLDFNATAVHYSKLLTKEVNRDDFSVAFAGMGPDGHIFGIKPGSPAISSPDDVVAYEWDDYRRLTPTINLISKLDEVVIYATGQSKHAQLDDLEKDLTAIAQPAQLLKLLPKVTIFNDYKGVET